MMIKSILFTLMAFFISTITLASPVNINTASAEEISEALKGVGMKRAKALIVYRTENGMFASGDQIINVQGIGQATYEKNKTDILVK